MINVLGQLAKIVEVGLDVLVEMVSVVFRKEEVSGMVDDSA